MICRAPAALVSAAVALGARRDASVRRGRRDFARRVFALETRAWSWAVTWSGKGEGSGRSETRMRRLM